jgi:hypothetical protein
MPTLTKNMRPFLYPKGSKTATGQCGGHHPFDALMEAVSDFEEEHGYEPAQDERCFITITFSN